LRVPVGAFVESYQGKQAIESLVYIVQFVRNVMVDLANYTPASAEKGYLAA
jgi:hypothetical protein